MRSRTSTTESRVRGAVAATFAALLALTMVAGCAPSEPRPARASFDPDSIADAFARPAAALFLPGTTRGVLIGPDGSLDDGAVRLAFGDDGAAPPARIAFEERWRPVAHWKRVAGSVRWDYEAVALPHASPRDSAMWVSVLATATNTGAAPARAVLNAALSAPESRQAFVAFDRAAADSAPVFASRGATLVHAWCSAGGDGAAARWERTLAPGASAAVRFVTSTYAVPAGELRA